MDPGTAPLTTRILFSASISTTWMFLVVTVSSPMCPAARSPLITREGKAEAPMPPGARAKVHYHERIETIAYMPNAPLTLRTSV